MIRSLVIVSGSGIVLFAKGFEVASALRLGRGQSPALRQGQTRLMGSLVVSMRALSSMVTGLPVTTIRLSKVSNGNYNIYAGG